MNQFTTKFAKSLQFVLSGSIDSSCEARSAGYPSWKDWRPICSFSMCC